LCCQWYGWKQPGIEPRSPRKRSGALPLSYYQVNCNVNSTDYHVGEQFREGVFQWVCLETGRWVTGCFYQNETKHWLLLEIGETGYNGIVKHVCDRYTDSPGIVQYYLSLQVRDDIPYKSPPNKGKNKNLPEPIDNR
uniref:SRCR domain-containing protein n=1 Tax=Toxocara canis TaxID=6265 RepID=A0A183U6T4_TOXCA